MDIPYQYQRIGAVYAVCDAWRDALMREIQAVEPDIVIMGSSHRYPYTALEWEEGSRTILAELSAVTEQVHVIASTPYLNLNPMECLANVAWREFKLKRSFYEGCAVTTRPDPAGTYAVLAELSTEFSNVGVITKQDLVCPDKRCAVTFQRETEDTALSAPRLQYIFRDRQHLTDSFVQSLTEKLAERLNLNN